MSIEFMKNLFQRKSEDWQITALIYQVSEPLQGKRNPTKKEQKIIDKIKKLRSNGKLNEQQINILDGMQWFRIDGSDEF